MKGKVGEQWNKIFMEIFRSMSHGFLLLSPVSLACVAWRFWLGALSNKGGRGQRNREEIGAEAT